MSLEFKVPGVIVQEVDTGPRPIEGVNSSIAGFVGFTEDVRNGAKIGELKLVTNWTQYLEYFGSPNSDGYTNFGAYLPYSVSGYFDNGGGPCYVASMGTQLPGTSQPTQPQIAGVQVRGRGNRPCLNFSLRAEQAVGGPIQVVIGDSAPRPLPASTEGEPPLNPGDYFSLQLQCGDEVLEQYDHLTMNPDTPTQVATYVVEALRDSMYVRVVDEAPPGLPLNRRPMNGQFDLSAPSSALTRTDQFLSDVEGSQSERTGMRGLFESDEITMLACPDLMRLYEAGLMDRAQLRGFMEMMVTACETGTEGTVSNRMVVLDTPPDCIKPQQVKNWLEQEFPRRSMFAALYHPWVEVRNPRDRGRPISVPPCGHMMGVWARVDRERGVHKAPANEVPRGVIGLNYEINNREQELLNPMGINCIRNFRNQGIRIWGARTLVETDRIDWRYISVRRLMSYIAKSIEEGTKWAVFEPNDHILWGRLRRSTQNFLGLLWRAGALVGASPQEAFEVQCDEENNPFNLTLLGRVHIDIKVAPVRPAEFVVFRISQVNQDLDGAK